MGKYRSSGDRRPQGSLVMIMNLQEESAMNFNEAALKLHEEHHGKIEVTSKVPVKTRDDLSTAYTPGVAEPCRKIHDNKKDVYKYTAKGNLVAVVSDGTAVLGLGNIGPEAAMPVMEGKAVLFKEFGGVDAFPICLDTTDTEEIIKAVKYIAPCFGGINLEDIASPKCFEVEARLEKELDIPVFHDDQHGTAVVVTAALLNALKVVGKKIDEIHVVLNGPGSAGTAIIKMLLATGVLGTLAPALVGSDVFIGVSVAGALKPEMIKTMAKDPIVFAMANPNPEIMYDEAMAAGVKVMGTGRSDFPNQINNVLAFPGIFRGALDCGARDINYDMKVAAAQAIAELVTPDKLSTEYIIPGALEEGVAEHVAKRVAEAAVKSGAIRK